MELVNLLHKHSKTFAWHQGLTLNTLSPTSISKWHCKIPYQEDLNDCTLIANANSTSTIGIRSCSLTRKLFAKIQAFKI
jgi:hypothetical protein